MRDMIGYSPNAVLEGLSKLATRFCNGELRDQFHWLVTFRAAGQQVKQCGEKYYLQVRGLTIVCILKSFSVWKIRGKTQGKPS